ncbi:hypothetical protein ACOMHN_031950 [Nucella lapillus]
MIIPTPASSPIVNHQLKEPDNLHPDTRPSFPASSGSLTRVGPACTDPDPKDQPSVEEIRRKGTGEV